MSEVKIKQNLHKIGCTPIGSSDVYMVSVEEISHLLVLLQLEDYRELYRKVREYSPAKFKDHLETEIANKIDEIKKYNNGKD